MFLHRPSLPLIAVAAILGASAASAQVVTHETESGAYRSQAVSYADLNLASDAGRRTLAARIQGAAGNVCGNEFSLTAREHCRTTATRRAEAAVARATGTHIGAAPLTAE